MARVPLSKTERKNLKAQRRAGLSGGVMLDDFADDVADLIQVGFLRIHQCLQQGILWLIWLWHGSYRSVLSYLNAKYCRSILVVGVTGASHALHICNFGAGQRSVSQKYGADLTAAAAANVRSGDAALPTKAPLHERRAKFDQVCRTHCLPPRFCRRWRRVHLAYM